MDGRVRGPATMTCSHQTATIAAAFYMSVVLQQVTMATGCHGNECCPATLPQLSTCSFSDTYTTDRQYRRVQINQEE